MNRPLSDLEQVLWAVDQTVNQNWVQIARLSKPLSESVVRKTLDLIQQRHPPLRCKIKEGNPPEFSSEGVPRIPLRVSKRESDDQWIGESDREMPPDFNWFEGPFIRATLLVDDTGCDLLITVSHIVADGISGINLLRNFLVIAGKLASGETVEPEPSLPERPSPTDLIRRDLRFPPDFLDISGKLLRLFHKPVALHGDVDVPHEKRTSHLIPRHLSEIETKALLSRSKHEKTTVQGAICAALLQTLVAHIKEKQDVRKKGPLLINCLSPVNIRPHFTVPVEDDLGNFISNAQHYQLIDEAAPFWDAARKVKVSLQREIRFGRDIKASFQDQSGLLAHYQKTGDVVRELSKYLSPVFVTNVGRLYLPEQYNDLVLDEFHYNLSINPFARDGLIIIVTTFRKRINLEFIHAKPYISRERAEAIIENTIRRIKAAIA